MLPSGFLSATQETVFLNRFEMTLVIEPVAVVGFAVGWYGYYALAVIVWFGKVTPCRSQPPLPLLLA
jgi:hypothetical protein